MPSHTPKERLKRALGSGMARGAAEGLSSRKMKIDQALATSDAPAKKKPKKKKKKKRTSTLDPAAIRARTRRQMGE